MIAVIFEAEPLSEQRQAYLDLAARLRPLLDGIDGFVSIERFESLNSPGKILSLSFWRDEEALVRWRELDEHKAAQAQGRWKIFRNYRVSVCNISRRYGLGQHE